MAGRKRRSPNHEPGVPPEPEPTEPLPGPGIPPEPEPGPPPGEPQPEPRPPRPGEPVPGTIFCCAHCAKHEGVAGLRDRA